MATTPPSTPPPGAHDIGGLAAGVIDRQPHEVQFWEKRVDALLSVLGDERRKLLRVDELRRAIESLGRDIYDTHGYYERWTLAIAAVLVEKGVLSREELDARVARLSSEQDPS